MPVRSRHEDGLHTTQLTAKEVLTLEHLAQGRTKKETARALGLSESTIDSHLIRVGNKLLASGTPGILHAAYRAGHLTPHEPTVRQEFTDAERRVWHAALTTSNLAQLAGALHLSRHGAQRQLACLMERVGARNRGHLVALGHAHEVLTKATREPAPEATVGCRTEIAR
ncbi:LuxR C-terminal-related transcriptional regulator [Streptomyces sp. NPDC005953]|uniref:LuxR C-terminal-related transcriptional regulator n=1 Tax=Streptomyces sp. NPDC005953 TaxID=3156719 RepID=UPI00340D4D59